MRRGSAWGAGLAGLACLVLSAPAVAGSAGRPAAAIHQTEHGVVHVVADDDAGIGYGYGYAVARDQICLLAEAYVTVAGERSRYFGPQGIFDFQANGAKHSNLNSDLYYRQVLASGVIGRLTRSAPPAGVRTEVRRLMTGYVRGYNRYLADVGGANGVRDPACHGKPWVRPITEELAYARGMQVAGLAGGGLGITGIGKAQPPLGLSAGAVDLQESIASLGELGNRLGLGGAGSNAIALGSKATRSGAGMVLGNPHLPWDGDFRLYQAHFTIPGEMDAAGVTFIGVPLIVIGHTRGLAWSHTVSSAFRFTPFELRLVPGRPTSYVIDGKTHAMTSRTLTVPVRRADGSVGEVKQTMWSTMLGPVFTELLGLPLFPWTPVSAYAFADANLENLRYLNHFYEVDRAQTVPALQKALDRNQGIPWANTIAADAQGRSFYADHTVIPHVTDAKAASCNTPLGIAAFALLRLPVLDGSRGGCQWGSDLDAVVPGIFGPRHLPSLVRDDYVENSNDSYWLSNPQQPLEGFARIIGDERTERSLRTRLGLRMIADRLAGRDGREGKTFTLDQLQDLLFEERQGAGELMRDALVTLCRTLPLLPSTKAVLVVPGDACAVLAKWDLHNRLDSRGALLFQRWAEIALHRPIPGPNAVGGGAAPLGTWLDLFDPARPIDTPSTLNIANPIVQTALGDAVADLRAAKIPLDAPLGDYQYEHRGAERIPMHGGPGELGVFQALKSIWVPGKGYPDVPHGSTFIMASELRGPCPPTRTLLTYSQSADSTSPWFADQTRMFSRGAWNQERFCTKDVLASPVLSTERLGCVPALLGSPSAPLALLEPGMTPARARRVAGRPDASRGAGSQRWCVDGGGSVRITVANRRIALVATTAPGHRVGGARPGTRVPRGWSRLGAGLLRRRLGGGRTAVVAVRSGRVRWTGIVASRNADARRIRALARAAGLI